MTGNQVVRSPLGLTEHTTKWQVIELWTIPAAELLALDNVGLIPWVLLAQYEGPPETQQARPEKHANLLAVGGAQHGRRPTGKRTGICGRTRRGCGMHAIASKGCRSGVG